MLFFSKHLIAVALVGSVQDMLCIVDTSLSVLITLRMCLRELRCLFGIFYCLDLNHLVRVFYYLCFHNGYLWRWLDVAF